MGNNNENSSKKNLKEKLKEFFKDFGFLLNYFFWGAFFILLLVVLFQLQSKISSDGGIHLNIDGPSGFIEVVNKNVIEQIKTELNNEIVHLRELISSISLMVGLFGLLVTAISIFFSLRESARVDSLLQQYDSKVNEYKTQIESKLNLVDELEKRLKSLISKIEGNDSKTIKEDMEEIITEPSNKISENSTIKSEQKSSKNNNE